MTCEVLATESPAKFDEAIRRAVALLRDGQVVALPTETVYGLAANALDAAAVQRIFEVKGRPAHNPVIVHVSSVAMARQVVLSWPRLAQQLADAFWPGPLTMVLPRSKAVPDVVCAGGRTVAVRWPKHPVTEAIIRNCGFPLAAPSANRSSRVSPTLARHVLKSLGKRIALIVDGGKADMGIESTVLDLSQSPPRVLRPGPIHPESLLAVTGELNTSPALRHGSLKSPGQLPKHYAPRARLVLLSWASDVEFRKQISKLKVPKLAMHVLTRTLVQGAPGFGGFCVMPRQARAYARALYGELHRCDEAGAKMIVVEAPPAGLQWEAIRDRLARAASPSSGRRA